MGIAYLFKWLTSTCCHGDCLPVLIDEVFMNIAYLFKWLVFTCCHAYYLPVDIEIDPITSLKPKSSSSSESE